MSTTLWLAAGAIAVGNLWLSVICIGDQAVLGGVTGIAGLTLVAFAASRGVSRREAARAATIRRCGGLPAADANVVRPVADRALFTQPRLSMADRA